MSKTTKDREEVFFDFLNSISDMSSECMDTETIITLGVGYFTCMAFATAKDELIAQRTILEAIQIGRDWAKEHDNNDDDDEEDEHDPVERTLQ